MHKILLVDDNPHIVRTLEIMLSDDGNEVVTSSSGEEAIEKLAEHAVDIASWPPKRAQDHGGRDLGLGYEAGQERARGDRWRHPVAGEQQGATGSDARVWGLVG